MNKKKLSVFTTGIKVFIIFCFTVIIGIVLVFGVYFPKTAEDLFGVMSPRLSLIQRFTLPVKLVLSRSTLFTIFPAQRQECTFTVSAGESVPLIADRLESERFIADGELFTKYLVYSGMDREIQSGSFCIPEQSTSIQVAQLLADPSSRMIAVVIFPGWRVEEIGQSVDSLGLSIRSEELVDANRDPSQIALPTGFERIDSLQGYMAPGEYLVTTGTSTAEFVTRSVERFADGITPEISEQINQSGLSLNQIVILASIIEREAQQVDEMPLIASVFLNRIKVGMRLESDPTVQYALGYQPADQTWWKNPLTYEDLQAQSPYNTYQTGGLPPTAICAPSMEAVLSILQAPITDYIFFRASCDGDGYHQFSVTYEEHLSKACP